MLIKCDHCDKVINKLPSHVKRVKKHFCSKKCSGASTDIRIKGACTQCGKAVIRENKEVRKSKTKNIFCSKSCAAKYNNTHKTKGSRRSKLEAWLETKLKELYPNETILFNDKSAINSELDIYFPDRKLAFELNGIFHFEPIYGENKLQQIQENDQRKFGLCHEAGISLCIIDVSQQKYFKEKTSWKYLDIINKILQKIKYVGRGSNPQSLSGQSF